MREARLAVWLLFVLADALHAQASVASNIPATVCPAGYTCTPKPAPLPSPVVTTAPACPTSFYAAGGTFSTAFAGFYAIATPITKCGAEFEAYSITMTELTPSGSGKNLAFTSTTTSGAAIPLKQIGPVNAYAFGNLGVAASGTTAKLGTTWGGFLSVALPFWNMKFLPIGQSVNGKWTYGLALGRSW